MPAEASSCADPPWNNESIYIHAVKSDSLWRVVDAFFAQRVLLLAAAETKAMAAMATAGARGSLRLAWNRARWRPVESPLTLL